MAMETQPAQLDEAKVGELVMRLVGDWGAAISVAAAAVGDRHGYYRMLAEGGPLTANAFAARAGIAERYAADWLVNQAASEYISYDADAGAFYLSPEQAAVLATEDTPMSFAGGFQVINAAAHATDKVGAAMLAGRGVPWGEQHPELFAGTRRFFKAGYLADLVLSWLPALDGVVGKLEAGATVADVGCGHGASTIIMAQAFPKSRFVGFDSHDPSIDAATAAAAAASVGDRVTFSAAIARDFPGTYDFITYFDCFHDMGRTDQVAAHALQALNPGGTVMLVEPMAGANVSENLNPVGRLYAAASVLICSPNAISDGGPALGTLYPDNAAKEIFMAAGFSSFRRATETAFNRVFEARA